MSLSLYPSLLNFGLGHLERPALEVVHKHENLVSLEGHQNKAGAGVRGDGRVGSSGRAWVYEVFSVVGRYFVLVSVSADQNINSHAPSHGGQGLLVAPGHHLMAVDDSDLEIPDVHDLALREPRNL